MLLAGIGASWNLRKIPCSRHVTICALNPQNVPITDIAITGPSRYLILGISPLAKTPQYKKKNAIGITRLKNSNALFLKVSGCSSPPMSESTSIPQPPSSQLNQDVFQRT